MDLHHLPRTAPPPRPALLPATVPSPAVPEVTLLFDDSDDSLIWNPYRSNLKQGNDTKGAKKPAGEQSREVSKVIPNVLPKRTSDSLDTLHPVITASAPLLSLYNPNLYSSRKEQEFRPTNVVQHNEQKLIMNEHNCSVAKPVQGAFQHSSNCSLPPPPPPGHFPRKFHCGSDIHDMIKQNRVGYDRAPSVPGGMKKDSCDVNKISCENSNLYNLIQDQNSEIKKLYASLMEILNKQNFFEEEQRKNERKHLSGMSCQCESGFKSTRIERVTSTQTSFINHSSKVETNSVGVGTDITWNGMIEALKILRQQTLCDRCRKCQCQAYQQVSSETRGNRMPNQHPQNVGCDIQSQNKNDLCHYQREDIICSAQGNDNCDSKSCDVRLNEKPLAVNLDNLCNERREVSLTLNGLLVQTIHEDPPSPEPSLHINLPAYVEEAQEITSPPPQQKKAQCPIWDDSPVLGESVSMYAKCHQPSKVSTGCQSGQNKDSDAPGATFYNNILVNMQQLWKTSNPPDASCHVAQRQTDMLESNSAVVQERQNKFDPVEDIRKQLMEFGISFIDPESFTDKQRKLLDTFMLPGGDGMISLYQTSPGCAVKASVHPPTCEADVIAAKYLSDAQLAAIAAVSPGEPLRNFSQVRKDAVIPHVNRPCNYSIATQKFLDKYGL